MLLTNTRKISQYPDVTGHLKTYRCATSETYFLLYVHGLVLGTEPCHPFLSHESMWVLPILC